MNIPIFGSNGKSKQNLNLSACDFKHEEYMHINFGTCLWFLFYFYASKPIVLRTLNIEKKLGMALVLDSYTCKQFATHSIFVYRHK